MIGQQLCNTGAAPETTMQWPKMACTNHATFRSGNPASLFLPTTLYPVTGFSLPAVSFFKALFCYIQVSMTDILYF
jgi:hypothetical protein